MKKMSYWFWMAGGWINDIFMVFYSLVD